MKVLTANRLFDGIAVWFSQGRWIETLDGADVVSDVAGEERLQASGKAALRNNEVVDAELIDVAPADGRLIPLRLRERIRAAGPTIRLDLGKQSELGVPPAV